MRGCFNVLLYQAVLLATSIEAGLKPKADVKSTSETQKTDIVPKFRVGQILKTRLYGDVEVLKVQENGVIIQKVSTGATRYDPFPVPTAEFDTLSETKIPDRELKKMQADSERYAAKRLERDRKLTMKQREVAASKKIESEKEQLYAENYKKNKRELDRIKTQMDRLAPQIRGIESEMSALGAQVNNTGYSSPTVTGIDCDRQNQNCRNKYQGGGETGSSYIGRKNREEQIRNLQSKRSDLILQYNRLSDQYNKILGVK